MNEVDLDRRKFLKVVGWTVVAGPAIGKVGLGCSRGTNVSAPSSQRLRCLYNGHILTAHPYRVSDPNDPEERHRLYAVHAVLVDPETGRIAGVYPPLDDDPTVGLARALPIEEIPSLLTDEAPIPPGLTEPQIREIWRMMGLVENEPDEGDYVDLDGAVVTPGLIDDHFHVSSWSKKLPDKDQRFGFYADIGDPKYYTDTATWGRVAPRVSLWSILADVNPWLAQEGRDRVYLHGLWTTQIDDEPDRTFLFKAVGSCEASEYNLDYLPNRIGQAPAGFQAPVETASDPSTWPAMDYDTAAALLVHTSGQACWYNSALLERFNQHQETVEGARFQEIRLSAWSRPVSPDEDPAWTFTFEGPSPDVDALRAMGLPAPVDVVVESAPGGAAHVPFMVVSADEVGFHGVPMLSTVADRLLVVPDTPVRVVPFYRTIVPCISDDAWSSAASFWGEAQTNEALAYGFWDPRKNPHGTNWYNGSERGLIQYFHDGEFGKGFWRPDGYAEHYVMRDMLSTLVVDPPTVEDGMRFRRNLARWCHRHGLTAMQDIMFYRRNTSTQEFDSCLGLSYDHRQVPGDDFYAVHGLDDSVPTGDFNLRLGMYYYIENAAGLDEVMGLAADPDVGFDVQRLRPPDGHPDGPGWVRWLGWKLQLDGGTGARTLFSNAPLAKPRRDDPVKVKDEDGNDIVFSNHGFGLLTMTNDQEQEFTSRESAVLYWLVRESDPASSFHNPAIGTDWSFLRRGVVRWLDLTVDTDALRADVIAMNRQAWPKKLLLSDLDPAGVFAAKVKALVDQVQSGYRRTLIALIRIWVSRTSLPEGAPDLPAQTVCHCIGDGAVDLYVRAIRQLRDEVETLPNDYEALPDHWKDAVRVDTDLSRVRSKFQDERFRVEHLLNVSPIVMEDVTGRDHGLNTDNAPGTSNVVFSTQPVLLVLDGDAIRMRAFPDAQELWEIPHEGDDAFWEGVPERPRVEHCMPCPLFMDRGVPFTVNTDPPSQRDPRPALTVIGSVARTPLEINPQDWLDRVPGRSPEDWPPDYLAGRVYAPLGLSASGNPMQLSVQQTLCSMTFWAAYVAGLDREMGAVAVPRAGSSDPGWFADLVVWRSNPLAIKGPAGMNLEDLGRNAGDVDDMDRIETVNTFIRKFRPATTLVGGVPVYQAET
ncbi:MAG: hypothetical protein GXP54_10395 [Deltaproteobacteria bacterium]|nr:hypothetical protein [Deltaproteobacteria bacterium]